MNSISGILLSGGKSSRMGSNKAFLKFKNRYLFEYPLCLLQKYCNDIIISSSEDGFESFDYQVIPDLIPDLGPIGGLLSCLPKIKNERALVLSCDTPLITNEYCEYLISESENNDIVVGQNKEGYPEPLAAIYSVHVIKALKAQIEKNIFKMSDLISVCNPKIFDIREAGFDQQIFMNINTKEDFERAKTIYDRRSH